MVLRNTFVNAILLSSFEPSETVPKRRKAPAVKWADSSNTEEKNAIATVITDKPLEPVLVHKTISNDSLKPIISNETESISTNLFDLLPQCSCENMERPKTILVPGSSEPDTFVIPAVKMERKREGVNGKIYTNQGKSPFKKSEGKKNAYDRLEEERKYSSDNIKKILPDIWGNNVNNIIIQNPQKVEFNTYISRDTTNKKSQSESKKVTSD